MSSLDPPVGPSVVTTPLGIVQTFFEQYGWILLGLSILLIIGRNYYNSYKSRTKYAAPIDSARVEDLSVRIREKRLAQQAAWQAVAPSLHRATKTVSEEEKRLARTYGQRPNDQPDESKMSIEEAFGSEFYKAADAIRKKKKYGSDSSHSAPRSSGFKPYIEPPSSGGGRRFGGGPSNKGG